MASNAGPESSMHPTTPKNRFFIGILKKEKPTSIVPVNLVEKM
jgi:hypothetical protein